MKKKKKKEEGEERQACLGKIEIRKRRRKSLCVQRKKERVLDGGRCKIIKKLRKTIILIKECV